MPHKQKAPFWGLFNLVERIMSYIVIAVIIVILFSLGSALIGMVKGGKEGSEKMFKSLRIRISLSVFLFVLLMFSGYMGWIEPNTTMLPTQ